METVVRECTIESPNVIELWWSAIHQATLVSYKGTTLAFVVGIEDEEMNSFLRKLDQTGRFSHKTAHQEVPYSEQTWCKVAEMWAKSLRKARR